MSSIGYLVILDQVEGISPSSCPAQRRATFTRRRMLLRRQKHVLMSYKMEMQKLYPVVDLNTLLRIEEDKEYRDSYLESSVRAGIGYQVQAIREQRNLTQRDLASLTGTTQSSISRLEDEEYGRVSLQTLLSIAKATETALIVRFAPYDEFMRFAKNLSPAALQVPTISESIENIKHHQDTILNLYWQFGIYQMPTPPTNTLMGIYEATGDVMSIGIVRTTSGITIDGVPVRPDALTIENAGDYA